MNTSLPRNRNHSAIANARIAIHRDQPVGLTSIEVDREFEKRYNCYVDYALQQYIFNTPGDLTIFLLKWS